MTSTSGWRDEVVALIPALRAFAWSLSHNGSDADDLVQDTLIKAWTNRDKFEPGTNLRAWLFTILRNTYYTNVLRRRREVRDDARQKWRVEEKREAFVHRSRMLGRRLPVRGF